MKCPRDGWELRDGEIEGVPAHRCPKCNGFSFELGGSDRLSFDPVQLKAAAWESAGEGALMSPSSGRPMRVFHYRGVELDYCESSNTVWLDRGELEKISRADTSRLKKENRSNPLLDGLDAAVTGVDFVGFIADAFGSLFDGF
jgi:Zn-finger nucleic acid-binding protein